MAANLVLPEKINAEGQSQEVDKANDGLASAGFYPQDATSNDMSVGLERGAGGNLVFKDQVGGTHTLTEVSSPPDFTKLLLCIDGSLVYTGDGDPTYRG